MTDQDNNGRIWGVVWTEVFPWLIIFRTFRIAISFRLLVLGMVGMMAMLFGAYFIGWGFSGDTVKEGRSASTGAGVIQETNWFSHVFGYDSNVGWMIQKDKEGVQVVQNKFDRIDKKHPEITAIWQHFLLPFELASLSRYWLQNLGYCVTIGLWTVLVWGFFGTAIARSAAVQLVSGGRLSFREMFSFSLTKWRASFAAPLLPFIGMALLAIPILLLSLILRLGILAWLGAIAWPIALIAGIMIATLMLGLIFGWPLMISAIAVEGSDCFDALSRTYAYVYQRPLPYLFYGGVAFLFGTLGWFFLVFFVELVTEVTQWIANWVVLDGNYSMADEGPFQIIRAWVVMFKLLVLGFSATYFWSASVAIYLLLRRDTDAVELDEIYNQSEAIPRGLPKIVTDPQGAPVVVEEED